MAVLIPYSPRPLQMQIHIAMEGKRWGCLVIHRRAGKTVMLINHLIRQAMLFNKADGRFHYVAPFLKQAKTLAWDYLKRYTDPIPGRVYSESELKVSLPNGSQIRLFGADNPDAMRGIYSDGAVLDEYAVTDPVIFTSILRPALSDRKGWCIFSGTPNGRNHFYDLLCDAEKNSEEWFSLVAKASETGIVDPKELQSAQRMMTEDEYEREYECSFNSIIGKKIYPEFNRNVHVSRESLVPIKPMEIIRGWDNTGLSPAIVLTYLTPTGQWCIFKEFTFEDTDIMEAVETLILWCNLNLPKGCTFIDWADPAGKNRDSSKMSPHAYVAIKSREMGSPIWLRDGIQTWKVRRGSVASRLMKLVNGKPGLLVDQGCKMIIEGFEGGYAYREMPSMPGYFVEEAVKNKYSHIHDSVQYVASRLFVEASADTYHDEGYGDERDEQGDVVVNASGKSLYGGY